MRSREPVPDRRHGGDHPEHDLWARPSLTIAEAARLAGVSVSTIRRYLAAGRFPTAQQRSGTVPGQRGVWRIPTQDLLAAGLHPRRAGTPRHDGDDEPPSRRTADEPVHDRVRELEHALELERTRRQAAEDLAAERARAIQTLESALAALQTHRAGPAPNPGRAAPSPAPPSDATHTAGPALRPGMLPMMPKRRPAKRELSQEEKAAIIGRALTRQRPPRRRWL
jgi:Helix-turn-helix domain